MKLLRDTGSFTNFMLNNPNFHLPKVGEDITELLWTDRSAWHVTQVDPDQKGAILTSYNPKWIGTCYGDERYEYDDENGNPRLMYTNTMHVRYKRNNWYNGKNKVFLSWGIRDEYRDPSF